MSGKLIIIESGTDASGKATQAELLYEYLKKDHMVVKVEFPNYKSDSSALVKMYLNGDFGETANSVDPYIASTFYAADRYASFMTEWKKYYDEGYIIISDRYVSSNMVHQASKLSGNEREKFLDWVDEFEYGLYKIPRPDLTIFLDVPLEVSEKLMANRKNKFTDKDEKDIHERDLAYLRATYENALYIANKYHWDKIKCVEDGMLRTAEDISDEIRAKVEKVVE